MIIASVQKDIDSLIGYIEDGFVFVIDMTDRSFIFRSSEEKSYELQLLRLDETHGMDRLTKDRGYAILDFDHKVGLREVAQNTFMGYFSKLSSDQPSLQSAESIIQGIA